MRFPLLLLSALLLTGCFDTLAKNDPQIDKVDPAIGLSRDDYKTLHETGAQEDGPPIPHLPLQLERAAHLRVASDKILSISVTEKVPLKDVLMELAAKAGVDIEVDPRIEGGIIFTATRQPFPRILDRLCRIAGLRYSVEDNVVHVEIDEPYLKTYALDYLSLSRKAESEIGIATNVFASVQNVTRNGSVVAVNQDAQNGNNSVTKVDTKGLTDFWPEVEANIEAILANTRSAHDWHLANDSSVMAQLRQEGLSAAKPFSVNRQAGLVSVFGTKHQHEEIAAYLEKLRRNVNAQVLIEARIVEVELDENYQSGINWRTIMGGPFNVAGNFGTQAAGAPFIAPTTSTNGVVTLSLNTGDFASILNFVRGFGATRTLSSPRLTVLNNQPAVLKVARNEVYFTSTIDTTPIIGSSGGSPVAVQRTVNSTPNTVPVGFVMTVQPAINLDRNEVTLNLRPTVSFIVDHVQDPGIQIAAADANVPNVTSAIPVVAVREMDSVLTLPSGSVAIMGGLMQDSSGNIENGVPLADAVPIIGNLVKSRDDSSKLSELVILLKATIVDGAPQPDQKDRELYRKFTRDRHPLALRQDAEDEPEQIAEAGEANGALIKASYTPAVENKPQITQVAYYKIRKCKVTPTHDCKKKKPKPKKKKRRRRGASAPVAPMAVSPPVNPGPVIPPTVVPDYDRRPDTGPRE